MRPTVACFPVVLFYTSFLLTGVYKAFSAENVTTLFAVQPNGTPAPTLPSGYSVEDDGTTVFTPEASGVYVAEVLHSRIVVHGPSTALTLLWLLTCSSGVPEVTFSEDASSLRIDTRPQIGAHADIGSLECVLDKNSSTGRCSTYTQFTTFSGNLVPIATVVVSSAGESVGKVAPCCLSALVKSIGVLYAFTLMMSLVH
ncbi:hypothetical protein JR316_0011793 [Psilocybe cubensis]|uniref:Uncharacterized protein n=2 Tax=Psilocybe cubensis TaxID=181762 RepID=A0ACB8GLF2_PSICU|nr:hypothetical protein JR316_0011793 [Psilocybe cubensis]KAH9476222.1 hypothetical protein JR316_0011793 [Psilocybe cubensis]